MGATGNANTQGVAQAPTNQSNHSLPDDADQQTIQNYYKNNLGIDIGGSYFRDKLDPKLLVRTTQGLDNLVRELGKDVFDEMGIRITSLASLPGKAYAQTSLSSGKIAVNPKFFDDYNKAKTQMYTDVLSHFHPQGCKAGDILVHEVGHNLEFLINKRMNKGNKMQMALADAGQVYAKAIVQQAYSELSKEQPNLYSTEKKARQAISLYADSKWHGTVAYTECFAEAVADYARNGKNANPLSVKIWEGIKAALS